MTKRTRVRHRKITRAEYERQQQGCEVLAAGVWLDRRGDVHFSLPEILQHFGIPDTPEDRQIAARAVADMLREQHPEMIIIQQDPTSDG